MGDKSASYKRPVYAELARRLVQARRFMQVLYGPRQSGKTTLATQALDASELPSHYASADEPGLKSRDWIRAQWETGRVKCAESRGGLLVLDEVQKIPGWSETVKELWDSDTARRVGLKVVILGSAPLLMQRGLSESLAGRFEVIPVPHWSYYEMREAFGWDVARYLYFGGYPGAAPLVEEEERWARYVVDSLIETTIARDILNMVRVDKPALMRRLFQLGCDYSCQVLSYQKILGQLQEASNTTTLAHYLDLLSGAGMLTGLQKYAGTRVRQRGSSPKLLVLNTALMTAQAGVTFQAGREKSALWGRLVETAVGAHIVNGTMGSRTEVFYWRERSREVDFVVKRGERVTALEVKSGRARETYPGMDAFGHAFGPVRSLVVGGQGLGIEEFLGAPVSRWFGDD